MNELFKHQNEAIEKLKKYRVGALFMEPGTGKTRCTVELVNSVNDIEHVLYIAPLRTIKTGVSLSVCDEIKKWGGFNVPVTYIGVESLSSSDRIYLACIDLVSSKKTFIVCDESIKIKNFWAKRTKRTLEIGKYAKYKLILNGTPISRNLLDCWSQMEFLSPKILNMNITRFKNTFCKYTVIAKKFGLRKYSKEFITGYANIDYFHKLIERYVYNCDLKLDISQQNFNIKYKLTETELEEYGRLKEYFLRDEMLEWRNNNIFVEMTQKLQHCYCCCENKIKACREIFNEVDESKTIIFCKFIASRELCEKTFKNSLVLSYQTAALGLNLQDYNTTIYFDKIWDYYYRKQSGNRTYRYGQTEDCRYYDLDGNVGLESMINSNIEKKIGMIEYFKSKTKKELEAEL